MQFDLFSSAARAQLPPSTNVPPAQVPESQPTVHDVVTIARVISLLAPRVNSLLTDPTADALGETEFLTLASQGFGGTLAQGAFTIREAYDCLEAAMVRAIRDSGHLFGSGITAEAAHQGLAALRSLSDRLPAQKRRTLEGTELQQFSTPPGYGYLLARAAAITSADMVLEPSAGTGLLAVHANVAGATVVANEIAPFRASVLRALDFETYSENAEHLHSVLPASIQPSVIVMNPPFSAALHHSRRSQQTGGQHLSQALKRLRPNGRLCAIVGLPLFEGDRNAIDVALSVIAQTIAIRADLRISRDVYKSHGTSFPTRVLVIDKCAPDGQKIVTGEELDLKDALTLLEPLSKNRLPLGDTATAAASSRQAANTTRPARAKPVTPSTQTAPENIVHFNRFGPAVEIPVSDKGISDIAAAAHDSVYEPYSVQRLMVSTAIDHPTPLVTSLAMASVTPPAPTYRPMLPERLISEGIISLAQLEQVVYTGQAHSQFLPDGPRMGYFVGDGTGVGKGREGATIILDNFNRGRDKHIWLSYNSTLVEDARRDWQDIGNDPNTIFELRNIKTSDPIPYKRGILFASYDLLRSAEKDNPESGRPARRRLDQIIEWVGADFDGVIILDEAHCMANAVETKGKRGRKKASQRALCGVELQERLPKARVVYSSATGATEVANLAYADRLGLWGRGTSFTSREDFIEAMTLGGIAALEVVARDLKALGLYNARALSFHGVEYDQLFHTLTSTQRTLYDTLARAWQKVLAHIDEAMELAESKSNARARSAALSLFWSNNQRFWNQVLTALQMPTMIAAIEEDLKAGHAAVIQLTNTNEATMERALSAIAGSEDLEMLDMTPRDILLQYIKSGFPIAQYEEYEENGNKLTRPVLDSMGFPVINADAVAIRDNLLLELGSLPVPEGCLEQLINHFGEDKVAEVTGRKRRVLRKRTDSGFQTEIQKRSSNANKAETKAFMDDKKPILIFSQAGGTGRSYHSDRTAINQRKRIHYLAQAGWSAFAAIQGFGRTNRTNQVHPPKYQLVSTDIKGHKRFISTIARRLEQLGALTRGQRTASSTSLFSAADNLENSYASDAVKRLIRDLHGGKVQGLTFEQFCAETGLSLINKETGGLEESKLPTVQQFLNRLLSLTIDMQNGVFEQFESRLHANIEVAIADGTYQVGVEMITAEKIVKVSDQVVWKASNSDAQSRYVHLELYYPQKIYPIEDLKTAVGRDLKPARFMRNKVSRRVAAFLYLQRVTDNDGRGRDVFKEIRPNKAGYADATHLNSGNWVPLDYKEALPLWHAEIAALPKYHVEPCHMITGAILPIWGMLPGACHVWRVQTDSGERMLGRVIPEDSVADTLEKLGATMSEVTHSLDKILDTLAAGGHITLVNGWKVYQTMVLNEPRIAILGPTWEHVPDLRKEGVIIEQVYSRTGFYIPTGDRFQAVFEEVTRYRQIQKIVSKSAA